MVDLSVGARHPERFRCDNDWTMERRDDGAVLFRRWADGREVERFEVSGSRWLDAVVHVAHPDHAQSTPAARIARAQLEYLHLGPREG